MIHGLVPKYLSNLVPQTVSNISSYNLRNQNDYRELPCRTVRFKQSFLPSVIHIWNTLSSEIREQSTVQLFIETISNETCRASNKLMLYGTDQSAINHSRVRMGLSALNQQRRKYNFIDSGRCPTCNFIREDAFHYFLKCPTYATHRNVLFEKMCQTLAPDVKAELLIPESTTEMKEFLQIILYGSAESAYEANLSLFNSIHAYIKTTKRFK